MGRIRAMRPDFFMDEETAVLQPDTQLLLLGLATLADRDGRLEDRPVRIKACLFPYRDVDVDAHLRTLEEVGQVIRYEADGKRCVSLVHFARDQKPHPKETSFDLPDPPVKRREMPREGPEASRRVPMVVGCGGGSGCGSTSASSACAVSDDVADDLPDASAHADSMAEPFALKPDRPPEKSRRAPKPPTEPKGDPRHHPLFRAMDAAYAEVLQSEKWDTAGAMGGREAKAISALLAKADASPETAGEKAPAEILRRWRNALGDPFSRVRYAHVLVDRWGAYATARVAGQATNPRAPVRAESQPQYDPSKPGLQTFTGKNAL